MMKIVIDTVGEYNDFNSLEEAIEHFESLIKNLEDDNDDLKADLASKEDLIEELNGRISEVEEELESAVADYENVKAELEDFNKGKEE